MENKELRQRINVGIGLIVLAVLLINGRQISRSIIGVLGLFQAFWIGIAIAFVFNRPYEFCKAKYQKSGKIKKGAASVLAIVTVYLAVLAVIAAMVSVVIPQLTNSIRLLIENAGFYLANLQQELDMLMRFLNLPQVDLSNLSNAILDGLVHLDSTTGSLVSTVLSATGTVVSAIATAAIAIIFSIYLLAGKERLLKQANRLFRAYLPQKAYDFLKYFQGVTVQSFENYIMGQGIEAVILGSLCCIGMLILRLDYASLVSVVVGVTALIPILGAYIGGAVAVLLLLMVSPIKACIFLIFFVILQQVENKLIYPRVVGGRIGLSGMWVLLAITVGTKLGGIFGTILGVPVTAIIYTLLKDGVARREKQRCGAIEQTE